MKRVLTEQKGVTVLTQARVESLEKDGLYKRVVISRGDYENSFKVDEVLVASSRNPNVDMGLENAGIKHSAKGIIVNNYLQTSVKHIYAAGDILGKDGHTHAALLESKVVANNILRRNKIEPDYSGMPNIIFTYPGIATVGLSEDDCLKRDLEINKATAPLNIISRSNTSDFRDGFVKIITDKKGVILGATIVAPHAAEMIHELALAVKYQMVAHAVANLPHAFLSWSEAIRVAASKID